MEECNFDRTAINIHWLHSPLTVSPSAEEFIGEDYEHQPEQMTPMKRELNTQNEPQANTQAEGDD
jgi:hypothetical protein